MQAVYKCRPFVNKEQLFVANMLTSDLANSAHDLTHYNLSICKSESKSSFKK